MSHHDQSHMPVQPGPEPALIVVQPQFSFGILVEPLDYPPVVARTTWSWRLRESRPQAKQYLDSPCCPAGGVAR